MLKLITTYGKTRHINAFQIVEVDIDYNDNIVIYLTNGSRDTFVGELRDILSRIDEILYK